MPRTGHVSERMCRVRPVSRDKEGHRGGRGGAKGAGGSLVRDLIEAVRAALLEGHLLVGLEDVVSSLLLLPPPRPAPGPPAATAATPPPEAPAPPAPATAPPSPRAPTATAASTPANTRRTGEYGQNSASVPCITPADPSRNLGLRRFARSSHRPRGQGGFAATARLRRVRPPDAPAPELGSTVTPSPSDPGIWGFTCFPVPASRVRSLPKPKALGWVSFTSAGRDNSAAQF